MLNFVPLINGDAYDWVDITVTALGAPFSQISAINFSEKQDIKDNYGWYNQPISRSYGNVTYSGSIKLKQDIWRQICQSAPNGSARQIPPFTVSIQFGSFETSNVFSARHVLHDVQFMESSLDATQGETDLTITIPIVISAIEWWTV